MTELSELLPVVFATVQLSLLLIVPVGQEITAHRTPERTQTVSVTHARYKIHQQKREEIMDERLGFFPSVKQSPPRGYGRHSKAKEILQILVKHQFNVV